MCWTFVKCMRYFFLWVQASWVTAYWFWQPCAMIFLARMISNRRENAIVAVLMTTFALSAVRLLFNLCFCQEILAAVWQLVHSQTYSMPGGVDLDSIDLVGRTWRVL